MTLVQGELRLVTDTPDEVSQVWIQAPKERLHGTGMVTTGRASEQVTNGVVSFNALPGAAVMVLLVNGIPSTTVKLLIPDKANATLRECIEAVGLADAGTLSELESLSLEVARIAAQIASADQLETWAGETASAAAQAQTSKDEANYAANRARGHESNAKQSELNADSAANTAQAHAESASISSESALDSASEAKESETNSAIYEAHSLSAAERAEFAAEETIQQVEGDFATRNYVDTATGDITSRVNALPTLQQTSAIAMSAAAFGKSDKGVSVGQATSIAYGAAAALAGEPTPPVVVEGLPVWDASYPVYLWGDSAIDRGVAGDRLADYLGAAVHQTVVDNSHGGTPIGDVLFRTGAAPLYGMPIGGAIPATATPVEVDRMGADISMIHGGEIPVTWAGVPGKITYYAGRFHESGYHTVEFTRSQPGEEVPIAVPTRLEPVDVFDPYATHIIVSGGNDWSKGYITTAPEGDKVGHLIGSHIKLVEQSAAAPVKHILIAGVKTRAETMPGDNNHKFVTAVNNQLKQLFPHLFVDRQRWLCERGPEILGLELTPDEQIQRDAGIVPARVFSDSTHVGSEIRQAEAKELWAFALAQRGWAQLKTPVNGHHMPIMENTITTTDLV